MEGLDELAASASREAFDRVYVKTLVLVSKPRLELLAEQRFLQASIPLSAALVENALAVQDANREYQSVRWRAKGCSACTSGR